MTKSFCDLCGVELTPLSNSKNYCQQLVLKTLHNPSDNFLFSLHATLENKSYGDICIKCLCNGIKELHDKLSNKPSGIPPDSEIVLL